MLSPIILHLLVLNPLKLKKLIVEKGFLSNDTVDIFFELKNGDSVVVEIETYDPLPGCHQALKYKVLQCAETGENITSKRVTAVLVARILPTEVTNFCGKYGIKPFLVKQ